MARTLHHTRADRQARSAAPAWEADRERRAAHKADRQARQDRKGRMILASDADAYYFDN